MVTTRVTEDGWLALEGWIEQAFHGLVRKHGGPMAPHSLGVGRALRADGADDVTVFAGYAHDILEDTDVPEERLLAAAELVLRDPVAAAEAVHLAKECCYTEAEYTLAKKDRKVAACARWTAHDDDRVARIKKADVENNRLDAAAVSAQFEADYLAWAGPLHAALSERLAGPKPH